MSYKDASLDGHKISKTPINKDSFSKNVNRDLPTSDPPETWKGLVAECLETDRSSEWNKAFIKDPQRPSKRLTPIYLISISFMRKKGRVNT